MNRKPFMSQMSPQSPRLASEGVQAACEAQILFLSGWYASDGLLFLLVTIREALREQHHSHAHLLLYPQSRPLRKAMSIIRTSAMQFRVMRRRGKNHKGRFGSQMSNPWR